MSLINEQYDANGPVERRETSSLLMSTCPITMVYSNTRDRNASGPKVEYHCRQFESLS